MIYIIDPFNRNPQVITLISETLSQQLNIEHKVIATARGDFEILPQHYINFFIGVTHLPLGKINIYTRIFIFVMWLPSLLKVALSIKWNSPILYGAKLSILPLDFLLLFILKIKKCRILYINHSVPSRVQENLSFKILQALKIKVICLSNFVENQLDDFIDKNLVTTIKLSTHESIYGKYTQSKSIKNISQKTSHLLFISSITPWRGCDNFIQIVNRINNTLDNVTFSIIGKCQSLQYKNYLHQLIENYNLEDKLRLFQTEPYTNQQLVYEVKASSLIVLPYKQVSQSGLLPVLIGLKANVIASNIGSIPEFILSDDFLFEPDDIETAARQAINILKNEKIVDYQAIYSAPSDIEFCKKLITVLNT
jgi:glycosyltransferase involved in cell wall biosynthesis